MLAKKTYLIVYVEWKRKSWSWNEVSFLEQGSEMNSFFS